MPRKTQANELPANILSEGRCDRCWCQGNLQHSWLTFGNGMRFGQRLYYANGIINDTLSLLLLLLGLVGHE